MRVLMVLGESTGGIGAHVDRLTSDLRAAGHEVTLATSSATAETFGWQDAHLLWPVHRGLAAPRGLVDWHRLKNLAGTVDVVHAHGHQAAVVAAVAVARARPRPGFVVSLHNTLPPNVATPPVDGGASRVVGGVEDVDGGATRVVGGVEDVDGGATRVVGGVEDVDGGAARVVGGGAGDVDGGATRVVGGGAGDVDGGATRGVGGGAGDVDGGDSRAVGGGSVPARASVARVVRRALAWALQRAAVVTGASPDLVELARALGATRVELATVPSPAVASLLRNPRATAASRSEARARLSETVAGVRLAPDRPLVLTVARIAPQKDLPTLVAAARAAEVPAEWVVVGGGDERLRASLESELSGIPLHLVGPQRDVEDWLTAADVFVLTSRWEARALVVQEAMAAGLPVVVTRIGGLPDLVGDAGVLVPVGDSRAVAAAVDQLLRDDGLRQSLGERARERARTWASPEEEARRWVSRYTAAPTP